MESSVGELIGPETGAAAPTPGLSTGSELASIGRANSNSDLFGPHFPHHRKFLIRGWSWHSRPAAVCLVSPSARTAGRLIWPSVRDHGLTGNSFGLDLLCSRPIRRMGVSTPDNNQLEVTTYEIERSDR